MADKSRQRVVRADGRTISVVQRRAHLSYCFTGCCCGKIERGCAAVPAYTFTAEWRRRKLRIIDSETGPQPSGRARQLADRMRGTHLALDEVRLVDLVRATAERSTAQP